MPLLPTIGGEGIMFSGRPFVTAIHVLRVKGYLDISLLSGRISMQFATNSNHASGHC